MDATGDCCFGNGSLNSSGESELKLHVTFARQLPEQNKRATGQARDSSADCANQKSHGHLHRDLLPSLEVVQPLRRTAIHRQDHRCFAPPSVSAGTKPAAKALIRSIFTDSPFCRVSRAICAPPALLCPPLAGNIADSRASVKSRRENFSSGDVIPTAGFVHLLEEDYHSRAIEVTVNSSFRGEAQSPRKKDRMK